MKSLRDRVRRIEAHIGAGEQPKLFQDGQLSFDLFTIGLRAGEHRVDRIVTADRPNWWEPMAAMMARA